MNNSAIMDKVRTLQVELDAAAPRQDKSVYEAELDEAKAETEYNQACENLDYMVDLRGQLQFEQQPLIKNGELEEAKKIACDIVELEYDICLAEGHADRCREVYDKALTAHVDAVSAAAKESNATVIGFIQALIDAID